MKGLNYLLALSPLLAWPLASFSQNEGAQMERGSVWPGYIITNEGDTVQGHLLNINLWMNQNMTFFYTDPDDRKTRVKYRPKEIKAYQVGNRYYESVKYPFPYGNHPVSFILRRIDGPIRCYVWYYNMEKSRLMSSDFNLDDLAKVILFEEKDLATSHYGVGEDGKFTELTSFKFLVKFAKNMSEYVKDDPELARKILEKQEGYLGIPRDIERIIKEYNQNKGTER
ncbi:MAG: hypothetical protein R6V75_03895 [Bacteroidales bacterium]